MAEEEIVRRQGKRKGIIGRKDRTQKKGIVEDRVERKVKEKKKDRVERKVKGWKRRTLKEDRRKGKE